MSSKTLMGKIKNQAEDKIFGKAWVVSVNMGYGHQRTAYPLRSLAYKGNILNANDYLGIPKRDCKIWEDSRRFYEAISKFKRAPVIGGAAFFCYDKLFQRILNFYPMKDLSNPTFLTAQTYGLIKKGWGEDFIARMAQSPMPLVTTFFIPAFMAEEFDYPEEIYLIVCDADVSRQWVSKNPLNSRINYCVPNARVRERLKLYGVPKKRIFLTGYPLPEANISSAKENGSFNTDVIKKDLARRLVNLDPEGTYISRYRELVDDVVGKLPAYSGHPLTLMFSAGGAGAQGEIAITIACQIKESILGGNVKLILSAGINYKLKKQFEAAAKKMKLANCPELEILYEKNIGDYFNRFNKTLRTVDILWTKPSELSFYSALGIPIIVAPPIGSQEDFNKSWLLKSGFGFEQDDMRCVGEWLGDWLAQGYLAEAAVEGFVEGEKKGTNNIRNLVLNGEKIEQNDRNNFKFACSARELNKKPL